MTRCTRKGVTCRRHLIRAVLTTVFTLVGFILLTLGTAVFVAAEFSLTRAGTKHSRCQRPYRWSAGPDRAAAHRTLSFQLSGAQIGISSPLITGYLAEP